jgi:hypothetical protein
LPADVEALTCGRPAVLFGRIAVTSPLRSDGAQGWLGEFVGLEALMLEGVTDAVLAVNEQGRIDPTDRRGAFAATRFPICRAHRSKY